ncbi:MAG: hypothetical protein ACTSXT_13720 [Candidatus Helarchaeota archaeon]
MLKIEKKPKYLSPSSLVIAITNPNTFYLTRLILNPINKEPQGKGAGVGTAFDILVKKQLWEEKIDPQSKLIFFDKIEKGLEDPNFKKEALRIGKKILYQYNLIAKDQVKFNKLELWKRFMLEDVPIFTKIDATCMENGLEIPFDWKCSGFNPDSQNGISPCQGFQYQYQGNKVLKTHKKYYKGIQLHEINLKWAIQLGTYGWALNLKDNFPVRIDQITNSTKGIIKVSSFKAYINKAFQKVVKNSYIQIWNELQSGDYLNRIASLYDQNLVYINSKNESWTKSLKIENGLLC